MTSIFRPALAGGLALAAALHALLPGDARAQTPPDTTEAEQVTVLDGVYTEEQAADGEGVYQKRCSGCHAPGYFQAATFVGAWAGRPVRSLFRRLQQTMPEDNPGGLRPREYAAVISYMLKLNGFPPGETALPDETEALRRIPMVEKPEGGGSR